MKQKLLDFLGSSAKLYCSRIEEVDDGLYVYGKSDFLPMGALLYLIKFARRNKMHFYVSSRLGEVYFRLYKED